MRQLVPPVARLVGHSLGVAPTPGGHGSGGPRGMQQVARSGGGHYAFVDEGRIGPRVFQKGCGWSVCWVGCGAGDGVLQVSWVLKSETPIRRPLRHPYYRPFYWSLGLLEVAPQLA